GRRARIDALTRQIPLNDQRSAIGAQLRRLDALVAVRLEGEHYALVFRDAAASRSLGEQVAQSLRGMRVVDASGQRIMLHPSLAALRLGPGIRPSCAQLVATLTTMDVLTTDPSSRHLVVHTFSSENERSLKARVEHLAEVEHWVRRGRIVLHCQPIVPAGRATGRATDGRLAIEVLCRMPDAAGNLRDPAQFLPAIEQLGLSRLFDRRVVETTFAWYARHTAAYEPPRMCANNLTASSIEDASLPDFVADLLTKYDVAAERFCFEITESNAVTDWGRATEVIEALRRLGARVAVDDFGTGFATFSYLRKFKVDELKIDGSFIETVATDPVSEEVVRSTVAVARKLGLVTVAEYVTSESIAERVTALGVDHLQGHAVAAASRIERAYGLPEPSLSASVERRRDRKVSPA
ncbi:MAG: EAL domain-containing protein, partial [Casimicrobiaceae bacterium]